MSPMTPRQQIQAVWARQEPDRIPWSPMLGDSYLRSQPRYLDALTPAQRATLQAGYRYPSLVPLPSGLEFLEALSWQMTWDVGGAPIAEVPTVVAVDDQVEAKVAARSGEQTTFVFHTPWGDLQEVVAGSGSAEAVYRVRFAIGQRSDYDVMARVVEARRYQATPQVFRQKQETLGERGDCMVRAPDQPLVSLFRVRDASDLIFDLADEPGRIKELLDLLHERALEAYRLMAQGPGPALLTGMAFITTQLISPRLFSRYVLPYLAEYVRLMHEAGKIYLCHMCGHVRHLLPMLREIGVDGIDSLTTPSMGDTQLEEFWQLLGDDAILISGIDTEVLLRGTPADVRRHTRDVLRRCQGRHLILRAADEVPFGTPADNLRAVVDVVHEDA
ncbi:MAG: hypothetical protein GX605_13015 [Chloroflexi bacterium]|nr:hypothetical protein [Chloroflexota bacterium]